MYKSLGPLKRGDIFHGTCNLDEDRYFTLVIRNKKNNWYFNLVTWTLNKNWTRNEILKLVACSLNKNWHF